MKFSFFKPPFQQELSLELDSFLKRNNLIKQTRSMELINLLQKCNDNINSMRIYDDATMEKITILNNFLKRCAEESNNFIIRMMAIRIMYSFSDLKEDVKQIILSDKEGEFIQLKEKSEDVLFEALPKQTLAEYKKLNTDMSYAIFDRLIPAWEAACDAQMEKFKQMSWLVKQWEGISSSITVEETKQKLDKFKQLLNPTINIHSSEQGFAVLETIFKYYFDLSHEKIEGMVSDKPKWNFILEMIKSHLFDFLALDYPPAANQMTSAEKMRLLYTFYWLVEPPKDRVEVEMTTEKDLLSRLQRYFIFYRDRLLEQEKTVSVDDKTVNFQKK